VQIYRNREWVGKRSLVKVLREGVTLDLETMPEPEFRKFILWRMGLAAEENVETLEMGDLQRVQNEASARATLKYIRDKRLQDRVESAPRTRLRPFDERRVRKRG